MSQLDQVFQSVPSVVWRVIAALVGAAVALAVLDIVLAGWASLTTLFENRGDWSVGEIAKMAVAILGALWAAQQR